MSNATRPAAPVLALDTDGEEFALDFGFPAVTTRPAKPAAETTADDARVAREGRSAEFRAAWHEEHGTAAKPRG
jgi:hypothetical protein